MSNTYISRLFYMLPHNYYVLYRHILKTTRAKTLLHATILKSVQDTARACITVVSAM